MPCVPVTQEDKQPLFDSVNAVSASLEVFERVFKNISVNKVKLALVAEDELLCATDIAEYLVKKGVSLKKAHEITGKVVRFSLDSKKGISEISLRRLKSFSDAFDNGVYKLPKAKKSVALKRSSGSTNPSQVNRAIEKWGKRL